MTYKKKAKKKKKAYSVYKPTMLGLKADIKTTREREEKERERDIV